MITISEEFFREHQDDFKLLKSNKIDLSDRDRVFSSLFNWNIEKLGFESTVRKLNYFPSEIRDKFLRENYETYKNDILNLINGFVYIKELEALSFYINDDIKTCPTCGSKFLRRTKYCCNRCTQRSPEVKNKAKQTKLEKYGDPYYRNVEQSRKTRLERYGDPGFTNREKCKKTVQERYGVDNISKTKEVVEKIRQTKLERYGDPGFNNREQAAKTCLERYGVENLFFSRERQKEFSRLNPNNLLNKHKDLNKDFLEKNFIKDNRFLIRECCEYFGTCDTSIKKYKKQFGITVKNKKYYRYSRVQQSIFDKIDYKNKDMNVHRVLDGNLEIDIFLEDLNIGIEYNGLFYHQIDRDHFFREYKKFLSAKEHNIKLCQIYECDNINLWLSKISHLVGHSRRIFARKCQIKELETNELKSFIDENSLDNFYKDNYGEKGFGLVYSGELLSVLSFTKNEINQICTKKGFCVVGGFSKLIKHFEKQCKDFVIRHNNKFGITDVFSKVGDFRTKNELPFIITTSKFEFADCGKTIYIRTEQDE